MYIIFFICWIPATLGAKGLDHAIVSIYAVSDGKVVIDQNSQNAKKALKLNLQSEKDHVDKGNHYD